eukprot:738532-Prymnesium_polylepis.1
MPGAPLATTPASARVRPSLIPSPSRRLLPRSSLAIVSHAGCTTPPTNSNTPTLDRTALPRSWAMAVTVSPTWRTTTLPRSPTSPTSAVTVP